MRIRASFSTSNGTVMSTVGRATAVEDAATRRAVLDHVSATWYRNQEPFEVLVDTSPMVEVVFDDPAVSMQHPRLFTATGGRSLVDANVRCGDVVRDV